MMHGLAHLGIARRFSSIAEPDAEFGKVGGIRSPELHVSAYAYQSKIEQICTERHEKSVCLGCISRQGGGVEQN